jgi:glycosyltransferase involved in cell wall biosynthesis
MSNVSVVIPAYNAARFISATLESVLNQTYPPSEILVVNDGSTDETATIVEKVAAKYPAVKLINQEQAGPSAARNNGLRQAQGTYIALVDSDDLWREDFLEKMLSQAAPCRVVFSNFQLIDSNGAILKKNRSVRSAAMRLPRILLGNSTNATVLFGRELLAKVGNFDGTIDSVEDWDWLIRVNLIGGELKHVPLPLWQYRLHDSSLTRNVERFVKSTMGALDKTFDRPDLAPELQAYRGLAYYLNYVLAAGKFYAVGNTESARHYLTLAQQIAPDRFCSLQTFISFLKIYAQTGGYDLKATGIEAISFVLSNLENQANSKLLTGLANLALGLLLVKRAPGQALRLIQKAFATYPALALQKGVYSTFYDYLLLYAGELRDRLGALKYR